MKKIINFILAIATLIVVGCKTSQEPYIPTHGYGIERWVTDKTLTLSSAQIESLNVWIESLERSTSSELALLIIHSIPAGKSIEEYTNDVFNAWRIGKAKSNNGILILIAINDRKMRIETGYGMEAYLTDAECGRINRNIMKPNFKAGKYFEGIRDAVVVIEYAIRNEYVAEEQPETTGNSSATTSPELTIWQIMAWVFGFVIVCIGAMIISFDHEIIGSLVGAIAGIITHWMAWTTPTVVGFLTFIVVGIIISWMIYAVVSSSGSSSSGSSSSFGSSSGRSSGSSSSDSDFGGGGSGGGGASDSW